MSTLVFQHDEKNFESNFYCFYENTRTYFRFIEESKTQIVKCTIYKIELVEST